MIDRSRVAWAFAGLAAIIAIIALGLYFRGQPPPGDPIVVQPDPIDQTSGYYWTIGGDDPDPVYEPPDVKYLNKNAFRKIKQYYARARKDANSKVVKITEPAELKASFGHCSDLAPGVLHGCTNDTDCSTYAATCVVSTVRLTTETGTPHKFHWYLKVSEASPEIELEPRDYNNSKKWRSELCGKLIGDITVSSGSETYVIPTANYATISAEP
jgi:hypothetical protein